PDPPVSQQQAADLLNVSRASVQRAAAVLASGDAALVAAVERGEVAVSAAAAKVKRDGRGPTPDAPAAHPFAELMADITGLSRRLTRAMSGDTEESRRLREYLSWAGLVDHTP